MTTTPCVFCAIAADTAPATVVREWPDAIAILPRTGVGERGDHVLVIPRCHVATAIEDATVTGTVSARAAQLALELGWHDANLIANIGPYGSQTVQHLHWHLLRRRPGDHIALPWPQPLQETA
ncbi:HIT family protein [Lentzea cavernae]|uniref:Hydrolase n=1 Tax=Lentzea cavernae TaxID=2020703 RepID=A0ABQ3MSM6_9PSEU|nr:HIT family protein [Lentzea cavernae]GHH57637.1 hydrolase [Lentzea cavernae]